MEKNKTDFFNAYDSFGNFLTFPIFCKMFWALTVIQIPLLTAKQIPALTVTLCRLLFLFLFEWKFIFIFVLYILLSHNSNFFVYENFM